MHYNETNAQLILERLGPKDAYKIYEEIIKGNIEYEHLINTKRLDRDRIDEILDLILETICRRPARCP